MDVVVERAVDRATAEEAVVASSASCPRSIPSRSRARPGDVLARFAISATPAASIPFARRRTPTRRGTRRTRRENFRVGTRARTPRVRRRSRTRRRTTPLASRTGPNETRPSSWGAPARRSRLHRARRRTARRRVEARRRPRGSRRERRNRDETRRSRDETRTRDANWNAFQFFARVRVATRRGGVARSPRGSTRPRARGRG